MQVYELKQNVIDTIDSMASDLIKVSQDIHARPELAFEEFYAANRLCTMVEDNALRNYATPIVLRQLLFLHSEIQTNMIAKSLLSRNMMPFRVSDMPADTTSLPLLD